MRAWARASILPISSYFFLRRGYMVSEGFGLLSGAIYGRADGSGWDGMEFLASTLFQRVPLSARQEDCSFCSSFSMNRGFRRRVSAGSGCWHSIVCV